MYFFYGDFFIMVITITLSMLIISVQFIFKHVCTSMFKPNNKSPSPHYNNKHSCVAIEGQCVVMKGVSVLWWRGSVQRIGLACGLVRRLSALSRQLLHQEHEQGADLRLVAVQEGLVANLPLVAQVLEEQHTEGLEAVPLDWTNSLLRDILSYD